ncbi:MAG: MotA/TolQ/ExbB proton channel family protein [Firmicutes bacterium]|nr:MotA/TolQ/ExbB proton channel family protein [Bacillota bacterium]
MSEIVKGILRAVSSAMQIPTIIILILLILLAVVMLGSFVAEYFTERRTLKMNIPKVVDDLQGKTSKEMSDVVEKSGLLKRQKKAVKELISRVAYPNDTREALARQLIADEESRYGKMTKITDLTARVAPMFGLMGTLIPLGPGLIALGEGDAATLSDSLLIAFDTTVAGLISGAVSYVISGIRKGWYEEYMIGLETVMETVLDVQNLERKKAYQALQAKKASGSQGTKNGAQPQNGKGQGVQGSSIPAAKAQANAQHQPIQAAGNASAEGPVTPASQAEKARAAAIAQAAKAAKGQQRKQAEVTAQSIEDVSIDDLLKYFDPKKEGQN